MVCREMLRNTSQSNPQRLDCGALGTQAQEECQSQHKTSDVWRLQSRSQVGPAESSDIFIPSTCSMYIVRQYAS